LGLKKKRIKVIYSNKHILNKGYDLNILESPCLKEVSHEISKLDEQHSIVKILKAYTYIVEL